MFGRRSGERLLGHSPTAGWAIVAMIALVLLQIGLGLFAVDVDGIDSGPLSRHVSFDLGRTIAKLHGQVFNILLALIVLHIGAVTFYLTHKKTNLIAPMITGRVELPVGAEPGDVPTFAPLWRAVVGFGLSVAITWLIVSS
jgi:cytochrome b